LNLKSRYYEFFLGLSTLLFFLFPGYPSALMFLISAGLLCFSLWLSRGQVLQYESFLKTISDQNKTIEELSHRVDAIHISKQMGRM